jgi:hypothetical protein
VAGAEQVEFYPVVFARKAVPVAVIIEPLEHQVDQAAAALAESGAERKAPQAFPFSALELVARDTAGREFEVAAADGAVQVASGDDHPGAGLARRRTDDRVDTDQHRRGAFTL